MALVIGGSRNQGAAIAENIASRGADIVISYASGDDAAQQTLEKLQEYGGATEAVRSDAASSADVDALFEAVLARHGRIDIVVHVPGAVLKKPLADTTDAEFGHLISLNTRSAFNTLRAAARHLADNGRYVVLSTTLTSIMTGPYGLYSGSKAAGARARRRAGAARRLSSPWTGWRDRRSWAGGPRRRGARRRGGGPSWPATG